MATAVGECNGSLQPILNSHKQGIHAMNAWQAASIKQHQAAFWVHVAEWQLATSSLVICDPEPAYEFAPFRN
jgi:hypothetical protein